MRNYHNGKKIVVVNIGTDLVIGDSFGPLLGEMILEQNYKNIICYGSLSSPLTAKNIYELIPKINKDHKDDFIIGTDALLLTDKSEEDKHKQLLYKNSCLCPGAGVGKDLPNVGDISILYAIDYTGDLYSSMFTSRNYRIGEVYKKCRQVIELFDKIENSIEDTKKICS